ncbi:thioredoxin domain-containing protein [Lyngbya confervoides]|uniref:Thioredoxin domain-containing protein n=1 Tax=Lyngbya confervoides BDU141951 TaxID=1574623 RepID=A0ABD4T1S0_9CYAN|nr:thioredoxin domain-containing protein [Lyngbya confervoides]MCM1982599.1 thioredoxin domain-containing protein [Lyngbya confervoides BDU141951]
MGRRINPRFTGLRRLAQIPRALLLIVLMLGLGLPAPSALAGISPVAELMAQQALVQQSVPYAEAIANSRPTLVEFYADWCGSCRALAPTLQSLHQAFSSQVDFVMLNIDDPQWRQQIQQFHATGVPHLALLEADHSLVQSWVGIVPEAILTKQIRRLISASPP